MNSVFRGCRSKHIYSDYAPAAQIVWREMTMLVLNERAAHHANNNGHIGKGGKNVVAHRHRRANEKKCGGWIRAVSENVTLCFARPRRSDTQTHVKA